MELFYRIGWTLMHSLWEGAGIAARADAGRGFDHGVFVPLLLVAPDADIPIVQLSLVTRTFPWMRFHRSTGYAGFLLLLRTIAPYCGRVVRRNSLGTVSNIHTQTSAALDENRVEYVFETGSNNLDHVTN